MLSLLTVSGGLPGGLAIAFHGCEFTNAPFMGGQLYVSSPHTRLAPRLLDSSGAGSWQLNPATVFQPGDEHVFQVFGFDWNHPSGLGAVLSNGLRIEFLP
ncbi:MAG: hypothetical protein ACI835_005289 [Planctomycetota bacterium]|jgi:hypothetical protein